MSTMTSHMPCQSIPSTNDIFLLREYNTKNLGLPGYDPFQATLLEEFYLSYLSLAIVGNDISTKRAHGKNPTHQHSHHTNS